MATNNEIVKRRGRPKKDPVDKDITINNADNRNSTNSPDTTEEHIKKRRGRKPKEKVEEHIKKRRGRKRKCEMNVGLYENISGFSENSIDTDGKLVQFTAPQINGKPQGEVISFGVLNIQRRDPVTLIQPTNKEPDEIIINNGKCRIDLSKIVDHDFSEKKNNNTEKPDNSQKKNKDISDFFGIKRSTPVANKDEPDAPYEEINSSSISGTWGISKDPKTKKKINDTDPSIYFLHHLRGKKTELPEKTDLLCWWCCHKFDTLVRYAPVDYDEIKDRFVVTGMFCSWNCTKAYIFHEKLYRNGHFMFTKFIRKIYGKDISITSAPPRQTLKVFGGTLSIDDFRNKFQDTNWEVRTNKMLIADHFLSVPSARRRR
jgi:hypothetical protein